MLRILGEEDPITGQKTPTSSVLKGLFDIAWDLAPLEPAALLRPKTWTLDLGDLLPLKLDAVGGWGKEAAVGMLKKQADNSGDLLKEGYNAFMLNKYFNDNAVDKFDKTLLDFLRLAEEKKLFAPNWAR